MQKYQQQSCYSLHRASQTVHTKVHLHTGMCKHTLHPSIHISLIITAIDDWLCNQNEIKCKLEFEGNQQFICFWCSLNARCLPWWATFSGYKGRRTSLAGYIILLCNEIQPLMLSNESLGPCLGPQTAGGGSKKKKTQRKFHSPSIKNQSPTFNKSEPCGAKESVYDSCLVCFVQWQQVSFPSHLSESQQENDPGC